MKSINDVISNNYDKLHRMCRHITPAIDGNDEEDVFVEILMRTIRKYRDAKDIDEQEVINYIEKTYASENYYRKRRKPKVSLVFTDNIEGYGQNSAK